MRNPQFYVSGKRPMKNQTDIISQSLTWEEIQISWVYKVCCLTLKKKIHHYDDVIMIPKESQITSLTIVYSTVYSGKDERKHQSSASLAFVRGIHRWPVISPHKGPVMQKMLPFDDIIIMMACFQPTECGSFMSRQTKIVNQQLVTWICR